MGNELGDSVGPRVTNHEQKVDKEPLMLCTEQPENLLSEGESMGRKINKQHIRVADSDSYSRNTNIWAGNGNQGETEVVAANTKIPDDRYSKIDEDKVDNGPNKVK